MPVRNGKPNHKSPIPSKPTARSLVTNTIPFSDHRGRSARMVFDAYKGYPLPPLFIFPIYFAHPDASPDHVNQKRLLEALENNYTRFRLELFFLPGASDEDCMEHYRGEKAARGDYHAQVSAVEESHPDQDFSPDCEHMPGLVPSYTHSGELNHYHSLLFVCLEKDWMDGGQNMCMVEFDPVSDEEWEPFRDPDGPARPLEKWITIWPINKKSPLYREGDSSVLGEMLVNSINPCEEVTSKPWREASERGWTSW